MKRLIYLAALTLIPGVSMAQKSFDDDVNSELDQLYSQSSAKPAARAAQPASAPVMVAQQQVPVQQQMPVQMVAPQAQAIPVQQQVVQAPAYYQPVQQQPVYQVQPQMQMQPQTITVKKEATTVVEASPLTESRADKMRKAREEAELQTEQKIVEKLEVSRMEDEKRRSEVLFGDKFNALSTPAPAAQPVAVAQAPVAPVVAAPVPVVVQETAVSAPVATPKEDKLDREAVRQEISTALSEAKAKEESEKPVKKSYFSILGGQDNYSNGHIQSQYSAGVAFGQKTNDRLSVEGQFNYSDAHVQQVDGVYTWNGYFPRITDMQAYQGLVEAKYELLGGMFRPVIGGAAAYTYRKYSDIQFGSSNNTASSNSIDVGLLVGANVLMSEGFSLGLEGRYMWNVANQTQANNSLTPAYTNTAGAQTPENMGYMNISLVGRMSF